jgi:hypothetical protein
MLGEWAHTRAQQTSQGVAKLGKHGHTAEDIERFEQMGFVMSRNRKKKKSAQISSRKAGILHAKEEKEMRESELVARFKEMIEGQKGKGH